MSLKFGKEPYLECSSKGDKRFSAFYARVEEQGLVKSIEDWYQGKKVFEDGSTGLDWRRAKGRQPVNGDVCRSYYSELWDRYFRARPELLEVIRGYEGFSDIYGQEGHACQAEEVYRIWKTLDQ